MRCFSWVGKSIKWICMNCENSYLNVFMCIITGRYTGAPKSQMEFDLSQLRGIYSAEQFKNVLLNIINTKFTDDFWNITLPNNLATSSATSLSMYAYYASLNILNADGLFSKMKVHDLLQEGLRSQKLPLEIHQLFPKAYFGIGM